MSSRQSRHRGGLAEQSRQTEVGDFDSAAFVDEDVFRLDVTMDDAFVMSELQRITQLPDNSERFLRAQLF